MNVNAPMCSSCHQNQASFCGFCSLCLDICLANPLSSQLNSSSGSSSVEPVSPMVNDFNQNNSLSSGSSYSQPNINPTYTNHQVNDQDSNLGSSFGVRAFKHAAAKVAAHNNIIQNTASAQYSTVQQHPNSSMASQQFDPLAAAKDNRSRTASGFPAGKAKRAHGGSAGTVLSQSRMSRSMTDSPAFDGSSP
ncbi:uncharacterized protein MELLADRAFT_66422 [Melampsora larici-populina 98AG31]|uniref:Uncharacterized protein n=1 Tax=Melampsora larici-populina (strain 98AG31 / pathotype 3-4-7) TaxID=747676 RepID=F4RZ49_MELLP|nr:uncharacterized protein MELLADRAFT_66422 [Melampsora larici-populina 98AG31]EGG02379.1 hypothetical protein MELLADRAFT_66422 [Melampsora larici-populina 98AG31]